MRSLSIAATGMLAQQLNVEVISNNIANMNTTGFKRQRAEFQDLLYQDAAPGRRAARPTPARSCRPASRSALGVKAGAVYRITEQGNADHDRQHARRRASRAAATSRCELPLGRDRLHPRRQLPAQRRRPARHRRRLHRSSRGITIPQDAIDVTINADRPGAGASSAGQTTAERRPARARHLRQRGRPRGDRRQPADGDRRVGRADHRRPRHAPASARCCRASSRPPTSTRWPRSPP